MKKLAFALVALSFGGAAPAYAANLVTNGGFETGNFSGWSQFGNTGFTGVQGNFSGVNPFEGNSQAYFGPVGSVGGIAQTLATVAGQVYNYSFALHNFGGTPSLFRLDIGGSTVSPGTLSNPGAFPYTVFSGSFTASSASTSLAFNTQQNPSFFLLDAVSVTAAVPEPAAWGMMILGFGLAGAAMRRRAKVSVTYA